nr:RNA-directed DNA polymerase, eukaryota, reverse transcriptase zinc-binding domain protein [Tanacetum cinerariifolium]
MNKINLMGISVDSNKEKNAAAKIGCLVLKTPFNYLGSRVDDLMSRIQSWHDVTEEMHTRRDPGIPYVKVHMKVLQNMESIHVGGLGVSSLFALNRALMFKWVWRFFSQKNSLWVRVVKALHGEDGKIGKRVQPSFINPKLGNGVNTSFWDVAWCGDIAFKNLVPRLYALKSMKNIEVASKLSHRGLEFSFRRNMRGGVEYAQFEMLKEMVEGVTLSNSNDTCSWSLVGSGDFSVSSVRKLIDNAILPKGISKTRWIKDVPIKINVHAWKVIHDYLPTRFNIYRRGIEIESILCPMCECSVESSRHLFFSSKMISDVMRKITRWWDLKYREINSFEDWCQWISSIRLPVKQKHVFDGICYIVWWYTWNRRNLEIFGQEDPSMVNVYDEVVYRSFYWIRFRRKAKV